MSASIGDQHLQKILDAQKKIEAIIKCGPHPVDSAHACRSHMIALANDAWNDLNDILKEP